MKSIFHGEPAVYRVIHRGRNILFVIWRTILKHGTLCQACYSLCRIFVIIVIESCWHRPRHR